MARPRWSRRLTGVDADRLKEEKARGITIDLGFAYKPAADGGVLGFVDVPGHEKLVRNMLAGATGIDHVLLVVAADDGPMPQTREHLAILDLLGLTRGVVALTKCDLVTRRAAGRSPCRGARAARPTGAGRRADPAGVRRSPARASTRCESTCCGAARAGCRARAPMASSAWRWTAASRWPASAPWSPAPPSPAAWPWATACCVSPRGKPVRVRGLHAQNREAAHGQAGQRLALNLAGVEKSDIARGDWIVAEAAHAPTQRIDARLRLLAGEARPLAHWTPVHLHLGAVDVGARVVLLEGQADRARRAARWCSSNWTGRSARCTATASSCATSRHCARWAAAW